jgi:hypothetical protein
VWLWILWLWWCCKDRSIFLVFCFVTETEGHRAVCFGGRHSRRCGSGWVVVGPIDSSEQGASNGVNYVVWLWILWLWWCCKVRLMFLVFCILKETVGHSAVCFGGHHSRRCGSGWVVVGPFDSSEQGASNGVNYVVWLWILWLWWCCKDRSIFLVFCFVTETEGHRAVCFGGHHSRRCGSGWVVVGPFDAA